MDKAWFVHIMLNIFEYEISRENWFFIPMIFYYKTFQVV